jgi:ABC-2 type transport system ATP-binding protein
VSTQQLAVAEEMADRIGIIHQGRLIAAGTREELRLQSGAADPSEQTFLAFSAQEVNFKQHRGLHGKIPPGEGSGND